MESQKQFDISKEDSWLTAFNVLAISMAIVITIVFIVEQLTNEAPFFIIEQLTNEAASKDSTTIAEDVTIEEQKQLDQENAAREAKWNANLQEERERVSSIPSKEIIGSSNTMDSEQCEQKLNGHWLWDGNNNRWICHIKSK